MKKLALLALVLSVSFSALTVQARTPKSQPTVAGTVIQAYVGEIDPRIVGDACIILLRTENVGVVGIVGEYDACWKHQSRFFTLQGTKLSVPQSELSPVTQKSVLTRLKWFREATYFTAHDISRIILSASVRKHPGRGNSGGNGSGTSNDGTPSSPCETYEPGCDDLDGGSRSGRNDDVDGVNDEFSGNNRDDDGPDSVGGDLF